MKRALLGAVVVAGLGAQLGLGLKLLCSSSDAIDVAARADRASQERQERDAALADARAARSRADDARQAYERLTAERGRLESQRVEAEVLARLDAARREQAVVADLERRQLQDVVARALEHERTRFGSSTEASLGLELDRALASRRVSYRRTRDAVGQVRGETIAASEQASFEAVQQAVLGGDRDAARTAVRRFNDGVRAGAPLVLYGDESREKGIDLRAVYERSGGNFEVSLVATGQEASRLVVAPGTMVKSSDDFQDTTVVDVVVLNVQPTRGRALTPSTICCVEIGKNDPRARQPSGVGIHPKQDVVKVASYAARTRSDWTTAQVALWAVANDCSRRDVERAPGNYAPSIPGARDLLERAGVDTNALALYRGETPKARPGEVLTTPRLRLNGGG